MVYQAVGDKPFVEFLEEYNFTLIVSLESKGMNSQDIFASMMEALEFLEDKYKNFAKSGN